MSLQISGLLIATLLLGGGIMADDDKEEAQDIDKLWDYGKPAESRARFEKLLEETKEEGDRRLEILTQIARTHGLERSFKAAHKILDDVEAKLETAAPVVRVRYLLERGRTFNSSDKAGEARALFLEAWDLAVKAAEHGYAVDAAHMMGIVEKDKASLEWNNKAIAYAEKSKDPRALRWLGSLYNNTGWTYHDMGEYETALELWRKGLAWHQERKTGRRLFIARYMVGRGLRSLKRHEEALSAQRELLAEMEKAGEDQDGFVYEEIGENLHALGKEQEAKEYFKVAHDILSKDVYLVEKEASRLERLKKLGGGD